MAVTFLRLKHNFRYIHPLWSMAQTLRLNSKNKDSMEIFISELTQRKANEFNQLRRANLKRNQLEDKIESDEQSDIIEKIHNCIETRDGAGLELLIDKCLESPKRTLSRSITCELLEFAGRVGRPELFKKLDSQLATHHPKFYEENLKFIEILALEVEWKTGQNIDQLIEKFHSMYKKNISDEVLSIRMRKLCSLMIEDCVEKKGESSVVKLRDKLEKLCDETMDYQLLFDLWRNLFESFWFSDQQIASELIMRHAPLRKLLSKQLSFLCFLYLRHDNTELVNRLIQIFLHCSMMRQVETLVKILFDFECWRRNMDAVLQIVQLCLKLDIQLTNNENKKFLDLLLKRPHDTAKRPETKKITIQTYQFKF